MLYLSEFRFAGENDEFNFFTAQRRTCYDSYYPFQVFPDKGLRALDFADITILYGGNGSGKTTALNVIAETLRLRRGVPFNSTSFFPAYCRLCDAHLLHALPAESAILTSDDVFETMLDLRAINEGIDRRRDELFAEAQDAKYSKFQLRSLDDYDRLKQVSEARRLSQSRYVRARLMDNARTYSNGESAFRFFTGRIRSGALYLLDEPFTGLDRENRALAVLISAASMVSTRNFVLTMPLLPCSSCVRSISV